MFSHIERVVKVSVQSEAIRATTRPETTQLRCNVDVFWLVYELYCEILRSKSHAGQGFEIIEFDHSFAFATP